MVKLQVYASLLTLTLATSSALASLRRIAIVQRDLDQEFSGREYLLDARDIYDDLEARGHFHSKPDPMAESAKKVKTGVEKALLGAQKAREANQIQSNDPNRLAERRRESWFQRPKN